MELLEGKSYTLNIDAKEFAEKTWRNALAELIKNNRYITIDRIAIGDTEDIAYVLQDDFEYEIPSHIWKYFKPYDLPEEEPKIATKEEIAAPDLNFVSSDPKMWMTVKPVQQDINDLRFDYPFVKRITSISVLPAPTDSQALEFALQHVFGDNKLYAIDKEAAIDEQKKEIINLLSLHQQLEAVELIERMLSDTKKDIISKITPARRKAIDENRDLRYSRIAS